MRWSGKEEESTGGLQAFLHALKRGLKTENTTGLEPGGGGGAIQAANFHVPL